MEKLYKTNSIELITIMRNSDEYSLKTHYKSVCIYGNLDILKYLNSMHNNFIYDNYEELINHAHNNTFEYIFNVGHNNNRNYEDIIINATENNKIQVLKVLHNNGVDLSIYINKFDLEKMNMNVVAFMYQRYKNHYNIYYVKMIKYNLMYRFNVPFNFNVDDYLESFEFN